MQLLSCMRASKDDWQAMQRCKRQRPFILQARAGMGKLQGTSRDARAPQDDGDSLPSVGGAPEDLVQECLLFGRKFALSD